MLDASLQSLSDVLTHPLVVLLLCAVILVLLLVLILTRPARTIPAFAGPGGRVSISRRALHALIVGRCLAHRGVGRARAEARVRGADVDIRIELRIRDDVRLEELSTQLQAEISGMLKDNLGLGHVGTIDIVVVGVSSDH